MNFVPVLLRDAFVCPLEWRFGFRGEMGLQDISGTGTTVPKSTQRVDENGYVLVAPVRTASPTKTQAETHYTTESSDPTRHCALCEHYVAAGTCERVVAEPEPIVPDGICDLFVADEAEMPAMQEMTIVREQVDGKGYIYIPVRWNWEVEHLQGALISIYGWNDDIRWQDSYTLHTTLVYAETITDEQLIEAVKAVIGKPAMRLKVVGMGTFPAQDGNKAIYLKIQPNDELSALQAAIHEALSALGVELSPFSAPDTFVPHITLAYVPEATVVPEVTLDINVWAEEVVLGRSNFESIGRFNLSWQRPPDYSDMGDSPALLSTTETWSVKAAADLSIHTDKWDSKRASESVAQAAKFGTAEFDAGLFTSAFLYVNTAAPNLPSSYRFPFAEMKNGKLVASKQGLTQALEHSKHDPLVKLLISPLNQTMEAYRKSGMIGEMQKHPEKIRLDFISEMKGTYPDIKLPADIDRTALGENAFFVTLPIGQAGAVSRNGRMYSKNAVTQMVEQINTLRPEGMWGHIAADEIATRYDPPAMRWLAAEMDSEGIAWGKGLPLNEPTREYYRLAKATNARVGTSLVAWAEMDGDEVKALELVTVDLADPARVGIQITSAKAMISTEMATTDVYVKASAASPTLPVPINVAEMENTMSVTPVVEQTEVLQERDQLKTQVTELQGQKDAMATQVSELTAAKELAESTVRSQSATISELLGEYMTAAVEKAQAIPTLRPLMLRELKAASPLSKADIDTRVSELLDLEEYKVAAKSALEISAGDKINGVPQDRGESREMFPIATKEGE